MKLPDVNVLLHAVNQDSAQHALARRWMEDALNAAEGVGLAWTSLLGFLRLSTRAVVMRSPLPVERALVVVDLWLGHPSARLLHPGDRHAGILGRLLIAEGTAGNLTMDAHLAALAIEHNAQLVSFDRDFSRFAELRWQLLGA